MSLTKAEQDTSIVWDRQGETATIRTTDRIYRNRVMKLAEQFPDDIKVARDNAYESVFLLNKKHIRIGGLMTPEMKQSYIDRLRKRGFPI